MTSKASGYFIISIIIGAIFIKLGLEPTIFIIFIFFIDSISKFNGKLSVLYNPPKILNLKTINRQNTV